MSSIATDDLPFATRLTICAGRTWPWLRGRGRLLKLFRKQIAGDPRLLITQLKNSRLQLELPTQDETGLALILFGQHDAHIGPHEHQAVETALTLLRQNEEPGVVIDVGANLGAFSWAILEET